MAAFLFNKISGTELKKKGKEKKKRRKRSHARKPWNYFEISGNKTVIQFPKTALLTKSSKWAHVGRCRCLVFSQFSCAHHPSVPGSPM